MKGRVACGMGMNELIITELVFKNTLRDLQPAEVAALLSCLVFQAQTKKELAEFTLTAKLKEVGASRVNKLCVGKCASLGYKQNSRGPQ